MLSPKQIHKRALGKYEDFLRAVAEGVPFFPLRLFGSGISRVQDYGHTLTALSELRAHSRDAIGHGYEIEWTKRQFRRFGEQEIPSAVCFSTRDDYTRFLGKCSEVAQFEKEYRMIVQTFPELIEWCGSKPSRVVEHASHWEGLLAVCDYLRKQGPPQCYFRELPVAVDTKFIERHTGILGELIPIVAPGCFCPQGTTFARRFGFREKQPLVRFRLLDKELTAPGNLPFSDFALPLESASNVRTSAEAALVIENELTFLTLPILPRTIAILGSGDAVAHLAQIEWLRQMRVLYWGDLDSHGFEGLSILRKAVPQTESVMMSIETLDCFRHYCVTGMPFRSKAQLILTEDEFLVFKYLAKEDILLEQERIPLSYATEKLREQLLKSSVMGA